MVSGNGKVRNVRHIGIIMDGNRRFARSLMLKPWKGHEWGARKIEQLLEWCEKLRIKKVTLFAFSVENFNRPRKEFNYLMHLFEKEFENLKGDSRIFKNRIRINFIGRIHMFPRKIQELMKNIMQKTRKNSRYVVNFAMAYGGRQEIVDAANRIVGEIEKGNIMPGKIDEKTFSKYLYSADEPELVIRTGGEKRTSNFLLWQSNYSEWFFLEKTWPELTEADLRNVLAEFAERERRFGK